MSEPITADITPTSAIHFLNLGRANQQPSTDIPSTLILQANGNAEVKSLEHLQKAPTLLRAGVDVHNVDSFIHYVNTYRSAINGLLIYGDITETGASLHAILDYHSEHSSSPAHGNHRLGFQFRYTPEWLRWITSNKTKMNQVEFAQFLEDNDADIVEPSSAYMMDIALSLEARTTGEFKKQARLQDGQHSLIYSETIDAKAGNSGQLTIPSEFTIAVAPFVGSDRYKVKCRLRFRIVSGQLSLWYELVRPHKIIETVATDAFAKVETETGETILRGNVNSMGLQGR